VDQLSTGAAGGPLRRPDFALYLISDRQLRPVPLATVIEECLDAGLRAVQLREKDLATRELLALAADLRAVTLRYSARLLVNDRADVALAVGADGVQRTERSLPVAALRHALRAEMLIGASVHARDAAAAAEASGANFAVFGPVYETPSKRAFGPPQGLAALARVTESVRVPVLAVGGVTPERAREVVAHGARGVAVIGAILGAPRPADAIRAFLDALGSA